MDIQRERDPHGKNDGGDGLAGLWRSGGKTANDDNTRNQRKHRNLHHHDHEYGDADATTADDAEEYIDGKRRKHFGWFARCLYRPGAFRAAMTIAMGLTAAVLVISSVRSLLAVGHQESEDAADANVDAANTTTVGYVGSNNEDNEGGIILEEGHNPRKRYDELRKVLVDAGVTPGTVLSDETTPQAAALRWLVYGDPGYLGPEDPALPDRYGLAVLFFATNPSAAAAAVPDGRDPAQNTGWADGGTTNWKTADGWLSEKGICEWAGIGCPPIEQEAVKHNGYEPFTTSYDANAGVVSIVLPGNDLRGTLPDELGTAFAGLETIDLGDNAIGGTLPGILGGASNLRYLLLSGNGLTGTVPEGYGSLRDLHHLAVSRNRLGGPFWHGGWSASLTKLRYLAASHNSLTGTFPDFSNMTRMNGVDLSANKLGGSLPATVERMASLSK